MSQDLYAKLEWLPQPPADFRARCRAIAGDPEASGRAIALLANHALNENHLRQLAEAIGALSARDASLSPLTPFLLAVVGNVMLEPLLPALIGSAPRHGISLRCVEADFAQTVQEAMSPESRINSARPDAVLLALDFRGLPLTTGLYDEETARGIVAGAVAHLDALRAAFHANAGARVIVQTLAPPPETAFGSYDRVVPGTMRSLCARFNAALVESVRGSDDVVFDVAALAETVGLASWHSPRQWNVAKLPFDARFLPLYADHVCRIVGALRGKSRRCLILDLDDTLWGGVIGDDGLEGIVLGQGDWTGEAFLDVQRAALALRERGIVLAVSSKNDDAVARRPFAEHPDMLLREEHIAAFQANWSDKATNIATIAEELALGLDSMVLLDNNRVERGLVREMLPQVAVPELPDDPALYARTLAAAGYFETIAFSDEDRKRASFYQDNALRLALRGAIGDVEAYLASLEMRIVFRPFNVTGRSRIAQLINKSNQFNLTTRRYDEAEVARFEADPDFFTLQVRLIDTYGDNGMISVAICRPTNERTWEIDTWVMSCRVLGRRVEHMVLREIIRHARAVKIERLVGRYVPTERNAMVRDHYAKLGFRLVTDGAEAATWELETAAEPPEESMAVDRSGFERSPAQK
jgi:FkbH-like protein